MQGIYQVREGLSFLLYRVETEKSFKTENPETLGVDLTTWPQRGRIEFRNLWAKYRPTLPYVLTDLSFVIKGGEKVERFREFLT